MGNQRRVSVRRCAPEIARGRRRGQGRAGIRRQRGSAAAGTAQRAGRLRDRSAPWRDVDRPRLHRPVSKRRAFRARMDGRAHDSYTVFACLRRVEHQRQEQQFWQRPDLYGLRHGKGQRPASAGRRAEPEGHQNLHDRTDAGRRKARAGQKSHDPRPAETGNAAHRLQRVDFSGYEQAGSPCKEIQ